MTNLPQVIDELAELLVVPSFTRLGFELRRRLFDWPDAESYPMTGRTVVLTGPTSGLGREAAGAFVRMGARVVLVGRNAERLEQTRSALLGERTGAQVTTAIADMADLASVRTAAAEILEREPRLDVIVDNAGTMIDTREVTDEGFERTFATMVLGPFVLVSRLVPRLAESPDPRIVAVTSGGMYTQALPLDDLMFEQDTYTGAAAYARAKRAQVALVREWAGRLRERGVAINAMHPGWADTPGLADSLPGFHRLVGAQLRSPREGVDTMLWLAAAPDARGATGGLFLDRRRRPFDRLPSTRLSAPDRAALWAAVAAMTGEAEPADGGNGSAPSTVR